MTTKHFTPAVIAQLDGMACSTAPASPVARAPAPVAAPAPVEAEPKVVAGGEKVFHRCPGRTGFKQKKSAYTLSTERVFV
jgi:hypothetical protein